MSKENNRVRSTTVLLVRKDTRVALAGDGQVTLGETVMKASAKKVRRLYNDQILAGFAGATGDIWAVYPSRRHLSLRIRLFVAFIAPSFGAPRRAGLDSPVPALQQ